MKARQKTRPRSTPEGAVDVVEPLARGDADDLVRGEEVGSRPGRVAAVEGHGSRVPRPHPRIVDGRLEVPVLVAVLALLLGRVVSLDVAPGRRERLAKVCRRVRAERRDPRGVVRVVVLSAVWILAFVAGLARVASRPAPGEGRHVMGSHPSSPRSPLDGAHSGVTQRSLTETSERVLARRRLSSSKRGVHVSTM